MKTYICLLFCLLNVLSNIDAQLFLQMEKAGSLKTTKFQIGDELIFKLKGEHQNYRTEYIENIIPEENIIVFSNGMVRIGEIATIRSFQPSKWSKPIGTNIMFFGVGWGVFSVGAAIAGTPLTVGTAIVVGTSLTLGWLIKKIFVHRTYRFKKNRRLRILDLRVIPAITA